MDRETFARLTEQALLPPPPELPFRGEEGYYTYVEYYHLFYLLVLHKLAERPEWSEKVVCVECGVEGGRGIASFAAASPRADVYGYDIQFHGMELCNVLTTYPNITFTQRSSTAQRDPLPPIDILHLDSAHTYGQVKGELEIFSPGLAPGAVILVDDLDQYEEDKGVMRAFNECPWPKFQDNRLHPGAGYGIILAP